MLICSLNQYGKRAIQFALRAGRITRAFRASLKLTGTMGILMANLKKLHQGMRVLFIEAVHSLVRLEFLTADPFIINKAKTFTGEIINLLSEYEAVFRSDKTNKQSVAQYSGLDKTGLERVMLGLEYIQHFNTVPSAPLLVAVHSILKLKSELFSEAKNDNPEKILTTNVGKNLDLKNKTQILEQNEPAQLSENKKKILEFISHSSSVRPKDLLMQFNHLTKRTVKRNLQELFQAGLLKKENRDKAVLYTVTSK